MAAVREVYPHADAVQTENGTIASVFNIGGNNFRLITVIVYAVQTVRVAEVLTHAEYGKNQWKRRV
jgi:mRNA interferase HigB